MTLGAIDMAAATPHTELRPRILLADDHPAALAQAARLLAEQYEIVGQTANGLDLLEAAGRLGADVVVLDVSMPGLSGFDVARRLKETGSRSKLVFLTVWEDPDFVREAMAVGGEAYVVKSRLASDLLPAVAEALAGRKFISPGIMI